MEIKLTKADRAVANAAATNDDRAVLMALHFGDGEIAALNGFMLAVRKVDGIDEGADFMLPAAPILKAKDISKQIDSTLIERPDGAEDATLLSAEFARVPLRHVEGTYPAYRQLFPTTEVKGTVRLSSRYLKTLLAIAGKDADSIVLKVRGSEEPVEFECLQTYNGDTPTRGLIMPMMMPSPD